MTDSALHLTESVFPKVMVRQWVCSLPWGLRALLGYDRRLCSLVLRAFTEEVQRSLKRRAKKVLGLIGVALAHTAGITFIQRFDSALRLNVHFHSLFLDGAYIEQSDGSLEFCELAEPTPEQVADVARRTARRVADALRKAGKSLTPEFDTDHEDTDAFAESQAALALCYASAARGVDITGERAGQPSLRHPSASSTRTSFSEASPPPSCRESMCTLPPLSTGAIENASRDSAVTSPGPPSPRTASSCSPTAGCTTP